MTDYKQFKAELKAFCCSLSCRKKKDGLRRWGELKEKSASINAVFCPDCGMALYWSRTPRSDYRKANHDGVIG